jgi:hypothetical protein
MKDHIDLTIDRPQKSYLSDQAADRQRDMETIRNDSARYDVICFRAAGSEAEGQDFEQSGVERPDVERSGVERKDGKVVALFAEAGHRVFLLSASQYVSPDEKPYRAEALREKVWEVQFADRGSIAEDLGALRAEFNITRAISLLQSPEWEGAARAAKNEFGWTLVYDCSNDPANPSAGADKVARGADLALVTSERLRERWSAVGANVLLVAQPDIAVIKRAVEKARHRAHVAELLKTVTSELLQEGVTPSGEDEKARLLKKTALHLTASLAEREQALQAMKTRLTEREQAARLLLAEMDVKEKIIAARDEAIVWLRGELEVFRKEHQRLVDLNQSLKAEALEKQRLADEITSLEGELARQRESYDEEMQDLAARLAEEEDRAQGLAAELADREADCSRLAAESEEKDRKIEEMESLLLDRIQAVQYRTAQVEERERIIAAREEAITWLKEELTEVQKKSQRLAATNQLLSSQLSKKEHARQTAAARAAAVEGQLEKMERTIGWRLLSRYGRIKYRYLLPLYRMLKLPAEYGPREQQIPALAAAANGSESQAADEERIIESLLAQLAELDERPARSIETRERQESRRADFYESLTLLPHLEMDELPAILDHEPPAAPRYRADVICFSIIDWEFRYQRPQQIMSQFAAHGHRVFYISTTRFRPDSAAPRVFVKAIKENVFEVQLAAERMPNVYNEVFEGGNRDALLESLDELRRTYHIDEAIGYVMIASWGSLALETQARWGWRLVYDCMDEWENFPGINREILDMEIRLVRECDLLVVTAQRLYDKWSKYNRPMALARNAVDYDFYRERLHPNTALAEINHPVVGYYGAIADWFDVELMTAIARARPNYTFVLIGGVFEVDVSELKELANVRLLGQQPYEMMPQYLYHFDACIIPFKINAITEATDPVKLYEYLSGGKPVVSVALPELEPYRDYLYTAEGRDDFLAKLDLAVTEEDREMAARRRELARQHTWDERYKVIERGVADVQQALP